MLAMSALDKGHIRVVHGGAKFPSTRPQLDFSTRPELRQLGLNSGVEELQLLSSSNFSTRLQLVFNSDLQLIPVAARALRKL